MVYGKTIGRLCTAETMSETIANIIYNGEKDGYVHCDTETAGDQYFCFVTVFLKKEAVE